MENMIKFQLLSIDAWKDSDNGWFWNNWHTLESDILIDKSELTTRKILKLLRKWDYLNEYSKGKIAVDHCFDYDGYRFEILNKNTGEPIFCLEEIF